MRGCKPVRRWQTRSARHVGTGRLCRATGAGAHGNVRTTTGLRADSVWPGACCSLGMIPQAAPTLLPSAMMTLPAAAPSAAARAGSAQPPAMAFGAMLGQMAGSATASAPTSAEPSVPAPAVDAHPPATADVAPGAASSGSMAIKQPDPGPRTPYGSREAALQAGGPLPATAHRRMSGGVAQPINGKTSRAASPSPRVPDQAGTIIAPSLASLDAAIPSSAAAPTVAGDLATGDLATVAPAPGSPDLGPDAFPAAMPPGISALSSTPGLRVQGRSPAAALDPAHPAMAASAPPSVADIGDAPAAATADLLPAKDSLAFATQAYALTGTANPTVSSTAISNPATSTQPGGAPPAVDGLAVSSLGGLASSQASAALADGLDQAPRTDGPSDALLPSAPGFDQADTNGLGVASGSGPPHLDLPQGRGRAVPAPAAAAGASNPAQPTPASRSSAAMQAVPTVNGTAPAATAKRTAQPNGPQPAPAGSAPGAKVVVPGGGTTATDQPSQGMAVPPHMLVVQSNASQAQPGDAVSASPAHDSKEELAGSPAPLPSAEAGLAAAGLASPGPGAVLIDPTVPGAGLAADAARLFAPASPAVTPASLAFTGVAAPAWPAAAQGAGTAATLGAPAPPAIEQLARAFASPTLPQRLTLHLAPAELGAVQIGIERAPDGPAKVSLLVERPETLLLLMRDQPALHRALDAAGLPAEGRVLHFGLGQPGGSTAATPNLPPSGLPPPGGNGSAGMGAGRDGSAPGSSQGGGSHAGGSHAGGQGGGAYHPSAADAGIRRSPARTLQSNGVDITA